MQGVTQDQVLEAKHTLEQAVEARGSAPSASKSLVQTASGVGGALYVSAAGPVTSSSSVTISSSPRRESLGVTAVSSVLIANPTQRLDGQQPVSADLQRKVSEVNSSPRQRTSLTYSPSPSDLLAQRTTAAAASASALATPSISLASGLLQPVSTPASTNRPSPDSPGLDFSNVTIRRPRTPRHAVSVQNQTDSAAAVDDPSFSIPHKARDLTDFPQEVIREVAQVPSAQDVTDAPITSSLQSRTLAPSPVHSLSVSPEHQSLPQRSASFRERRPDASWIKPEAEGQQAPAGGAGRPVSPGTESRASLYRVAGTSSPTTTTTTSTTANPSATASHISSQRPESGASTNNASTTNNQQPSAALSVELVRQRRRERSQRTLTAMVPPNQSEQNSESDRDSSRTPSFQEPISKESAPAVTTSGASSATQSSLMSPPVGTRSDWGGSRDATPTPGGAAGGVSSRPSSAPPADMLEQPRILTRYAGSQTPRAQGSLDISSGSSSSRSRPFHQVCMELYIQYTYNTVV